MASTNKTKNIELNQWVGTDPVRREDFNADNEKIDAAIGAVNDTLARELEQFRSGQLKIAQGSYVGSGVCGRDNPNTLTFDFTPMLVIITYYNTSAIFCKGSSYANILYPLSSNSTQAHGWYLDNTTWGENSLTWFSYSNTDTQLNAQDGVYNYIAIGI